VRSDPPGPPRPLLGVYSEPRMVCGKLVLPPFFRASVCLCFHCCRPFSCRSRSGGLRRIPVRLSLSCCVFLFHPAFLPNHWGRTQVPGKFPFDWAVCFRIPSWQLRLLNFLHFPSFVLNFCSSGPLSGFWFDKLSSHQNRKSALVASVVLPLSTLLTTRIIQPPPPPPP